MKNGLYLILFLCFLCTLSPAQEKTFHITGKISGNERGTVSPLVNAYIQIREKSGTGFLTDSSGHFSIDSLKKGKYHITFSFIGFQSCDTVLRIKNSSIDRLNIVLPLYYDKKEVSVKHARKAIKAGRPHLYAYTEDEKNTAFRTFYDKYKVDFIIYNPSLINRKLQGLNIPQEVLIRYNREIFKHLDKTFGKSWRQELPPGIMGMEDRIK